MISEYRLVLVEWADAEGGVRSGWRPIEDMAQDTVPCYSVGWLVDDGDPMVVCPHMGKAGDRTIGDGEIRIPAAWCSRIVDLVEKPARKRK